MLQDFVGKRVKAIVTGGYCVEDMDIVKAKLGEKYGNPVLEEGGSLVCANGRRVSKPWLHRERIGIFHLSKNGFYIENISGSVENYPLPKHSNFPTTNLQVIDDKTLLLTLDKEKDYKIEYRVIE